MPVQYTPGKGQHTLVRIEHRQPDEARMVVEFETSDFEAASEAASPGRCIRWALDMLYQGSEYWCAIELAEAAACIDYLGNDDLDQDEEQLIIAMLDAATKLHEYRIMKHWERNAADGQTKAP